MVLEVREEGGFRFRCLRCSNHIDVEEEEGSGRCICSGSHIESESICAQ